MSMTLSSDSRRQSTVAVSTCKAEDMAAGSVVREGSHFRALMPDLGIPLVKLAVIVCCSNQSEMSVARNPVLHGRVTHISVAHYFGREMGPMVEFSTFAPKISWFPGLHISHCIL
jgi:hypothetical protein